MAWVKLTVSIELVWLVTLHLAEGLIDKAVLAMVQLPCWGILRGLKDLYGPFLCVCGPEDGF